MARLHADQSGQALPIVLALITVIFLLGSSLAGHVSVALRAATRSMAHAGSVYAAEGAAELAVWWQRNGRSGNPPSITLNGVAATATITFTGVAINGSGWPQWAFDSNSSSRSTQSGPASYGQRFAAPNLGSQAADQSSPVVGPDGFVYVGSSGASPGLYAYKPDGTLAYSWSTGSSAIKVSGTPALLATSGGARMIVVATNATTAGTASTIHGLTESAAQNGVSVSWSFSPGIGTGLGFLAGAKLNAAGTRAYIGAQNRIVYAFDTSSTGTATPLWTRTLGASVGVPVALNGDGSRLYAASTGRTLYALSTTDGSQKWSVTVPGGSSTLAAPVFAQVGGRDHIYLVTGQDKNLRAYADTGVAQVLDWTVDFTRAGSNGNKRANSPPALSASGTMYVGLDNGEVWKVEDQGIAVCSAAACASGSQWLLTLSGALDAAPARGSDGAIYFGNTAGSLYRVIDNGLSGSSSWSQALGLGAMAANTGLAIGNSSDLYGFTASGRLFAVGGTYSGPACSIVASAGGSTVSGSYSTPWSGAFASWTVTP
jgi:outer membrane protein assembly factor BamB